MQTAFDGMMGLGLGNSVGLPCFLQGTDLNESRRAYIRRRIYADPGTGLPGMLLTVPNSQGIGIGKKSRLNQDRHLLLHPIGHQADDIPVFEPFVLGRDHGYHQVIIPTSLG